MKKLSLVSFRDQVTSIEVIVILNQGPQTVTRHLHILYDELDKFMSRQGVDVNAFWANDDAFEQDELRQHLQAYLEDFFLTTQLS